MSMGNKKISVCAYTDGKTETYEIREESKMLWYREYPIGQGIADFFHAEAFNNNIYSMRDKSPVCTVIATGASVVELQEAQLWLKDIFPMESIPDNLSYSRVHYEKTDFGYTEVLHTDSAKDLISFMLVNYIKHGIRFRKCKYCGKYFGIVGNYNTEYCSRKVFQAGGKTCKDLGSFRIYEKRLMESPVIKEYKRSYKAHNARVSKGLMTRDEFNAWSVEAREKRDMCLRGEFGFEEFVAWLDSDRIRARKQMD